MNGNWKEQEALLDRLASFPRGLDLEAWEAGARTVGAGQKRGFLRASAAAGRTDALGILLDRVEDGSLSFDVPDWRDAARAAVAHRRPEALRLLWDQDLSPDDRSDLRKRAIRATAHPKTTLTEQAALGEMLGLMESDIASSRPALLPLTPVPHRTLPAMPFAKAPASPISAPEPALVQGR